MTHHPPTADRLFLRLLNAGQHEAEHPLIWDAAGAADVQQKGQANWGRGKEEARNICQKKQKREKEEEEDDGEEESKLNAIPISRVQSIVKSEGPDLRINQEAYFLINIATEKFVEQFCEDAFTSAAAQDPKRFLKYSHHSSVVNKESRYDFLSDFVPEKIKAEDLLKEITSEETWLPLANCFICLEWVYLNPHRTVSLKDGYNRTQVIDSNRT
ncbi:hypothetical protein SAY87_013563 [Trapa incisa]|uniref:Transcription factor CBF/NF-Y/archaeal histone domain-containing protein n=1 Tax=Trapa incisa TaxID=236973 RepID=A0AAN7KJP6_9MYRT|nr:hypothetical protein SAY87_013563 [Trapa incisa]